MKTPLSRIIRSNPYSFVWFLIGCISFGFFITVLSTYPLIDDYIPRSMAMFLHWDTWQSFLVYVYNTSVGGLVNILNTVLFGVWIWFSQLYSVIVLSSSSDDIRTTDSRGMFGSVIAGLGCGCVSCGFTFLANIFSGALAGLLGVLPLGGAEFGLIGTVLIVTSIIRIVKHINTFIPGVCVPE
jgi:hypothetical protein